MAHHFVSYRQVEFAETDLAGIAHFSNFFRWMETTEHRFFGSLGCKIVEQNEEFAQGWPRVRAACDYHSPAFLDDVIEIHLWVTALKIRAIEYHFKFYKTENKVPVLHLATGKLTTVCVRKTPPTNPMQSINIPEDLLAKLDTADKKTIDAEKPVLA